MAFLNSLNIAGSGLTAEKTRMNIISENISNIDTTRTPKGGPYTRKLTVFQSTEQSDFSNILNSKLVNAKKGLVIGSGSNPSAGVRVEAIINDESEYKKVYDPDHPDADEKGYVLYPNVDLIKETTDAMAATRAYQANITSLNAIKDMASYALNIGQ